MKLRKLNVVGIERFRDHLRMMRANPSIPPPFSLLEDPACSEPVTAAPELSRSGFQTKRQAAEYLLPLLKPLMGMGFSADVGLWSWLALYYFDDICPPSAGTRSVLADPHYILAADDYRRSYRHLLASPVRLLQMLPDHNRLWLDAPLPIHGDILEQSIGRLYALRLPCVREVADMLYWDTASMKPKPGISPKKDNPKPGDLRNRLPARIQQLEKTYDLGAMTGHQFLEILGPEFKVWLEGGRPSRHRSVAKKARKTNRGGRPKRRRSVAKKARKTNR